MFSGPEGADCSAPPGKVKKYAPPRQRRPLPFMLQLAGVWDFYGEIKKILYSFFLAFLHFDKYPVWMGSGGWIPKKNPKIKFSPIMVLIPLFPNTHQLDLHLNSRSLIPLKN